jgi:FKBP-type peptidyl-prolyl cis-trans isomerase
MNTNQFLTPGFIAASLLFAAGAVAQQKDQLPFLDEKAGASYSIGLVQGMELRGGELAFDPEWVMQGLRDGLLTTNGALLKGPQAIKRLEDYQTTMARRSEERIRRQMEQAEKEGESFLAGNAKKPGVTVLPGGLQYEVLKEGSGPRPGANDTVWVHYRAMRIDGKEFENTYVGGVAQERRLDPNFGISGLREALLRMPVGSKWKVFVPADLGYINGMPPHLPPGAASIYELELISCKPTRLLAEERRREFAGKNRKLGAAFLEQNAKKEGVTILPGGIQYKVILEGTGGRPGASDTVTFNYSGTLIDGAGFANSNASGEPMSIRLDRYPIIQGLRETLPLMKPGAKWRIFVPSEMAYGDTGLRPMVQPGAALILDIELISTTPSGEQNRDAPRSGTL